MKVVFLHIPKTAGQSIHAGLVDAFGADVMCPARVNEQLNLLSAKMLAKYQVFSGHLDWSLLDCVPGPKYTFTVLREPMDRILSFYFYLREKAAKMTAEALQLPEHQGLKAALELSPRDYFVDGPGHMRLFVDDHYDNFYTHYFAARNYQGKRILSGLALRGLVSEDEIVNLANENIGLLDDVFSLEETGRVFVKISQLSGHKFQNGGAYRINENKTLASNDRIDQLKALGADDTTISRLEDFCRLDLQLWEHFCCDVHRGQSPEK